MKRLDGIQATNMVRGSGTPLHHQVYLVLRSSILSGKFADGDWLPNEDDLSTTFGVSRVTVRNALAKLQADELVEKRRGIGTLVTCRRVLEQLHTPNADLLDHIRSVGTSTEARVLEMGRVMAPLHLQSFFECDAETPLHRAVRLRTLGKRPVCHVVTYLSDEIGRTLTRADLGRESLYSLLARRGTRLCSGRQRITAVLADPGMAHHLKTVVGAPLLLIRRYQYDQHRKPVEYLELSASPEAFQFETILDETNS